ncbi:hypothetical protein [Thiocystis violacea]|uniref:hypothetical protein n=1 Tax=Thiocystis violacea TaxID=13725 RepID=UPI00190522EB|nr:hypothetical protein [Thiocystis violacea]
MNLRHLLQHGFGPALAALCLAVASSAQAFSLAMENGEITAVLGLEVQGQLYDLTFADGAFNAIYPARFEGYGQLAQDAAQALLAASQSGALQAAPNGPRGLMLRGCRSSTSCTLLIPERSNGVTPTAQTIDAREVIYSDQQFRSVTARLWPFDASTDTDRMPDMMYAIMTHQPSAEPPRADVEDSTKAPPASRITATATKPAL